jgi:glycosyltransferase involved in cell wall biosynthesis
MAKYIESEDGTSKSITFILGGLTGGGAERVAVHLMNLWVEKGYRVSLVSMRDETKDAFSLSEKIDRVVLGGEGESSNKFIGLIKNIFYVLKLRNAIKDRNTDFVISFLTRANIYAILACIGLQNKVIVSERNDISRQPLRWPWPFLRSWLYKYADIVTANSKASVQSLEVYIPTSKLSYIPNPVIIPSRCATPENSSTILNVARLSGHKRQLDIIEALSQFKESNSEWTLNILGEGDERKRLLKAIEEKDLEGRVFLPGFVEEISKYYASAAIFVMPSQYEGTPNALLEAMSYAIPAIVSDSLPGAMELIENHKTGLIYKSGNVEDLADNLNLLMSNSNLRKSLGKAAREHVKRYSPENVLAIWDELLKS